MRILFVSNYPHLPDIQGGLQTTTHDLCLAIKDLGAEVAVLCGQCEHGNADPSSPALCDEELGYLVMRSATPESALAMAAAAWNATAIVVQSGTALLPMVLASLATGRPTAVYLHNVETHQLAGTLLPDASLLYFANSDFTAERWRTLFGIDCTVVPPIIAPERYVVTETGNKVLFVNPTPIKGVEIMFGLAAACPELPFLVLESWNLSPQWRNHCQARAQRLGNIEWRSPTQDMRQVFHEARVLLMPSVWEESFGRTVVEAQLNGLPVLASTRGALPRLVGAGGLVIDPHAPLSDWARALRQLYNACDTGSFRAAAKRQATEHVLSTPFVISTMLTQLAAHGLR